MSDALLDEVLANPHSDAPRRVYADWLSERGDPRGEFIATQCELARRFDFDLAVREHQLLHAHRRRWLAELGLDYGTFVRGFIETLELSASELATVKLERMPLQRLIVTNASDVKKLSAIPVVPSFGLRGAKLNDKAVRALVATPVVAGTKRLAFHGGQIVDASGLVDACAEAVHFDAVKIRNLEVLAASAWMACVRELRIGIPCDYFLKSCNMPRLTSLTVDSVIMPSTFLALGRMPELEYLEVPIGEYDLPTFGFAKLKQLVIRGYTDGPVLAALRERWGERLTIVPATTKRWHL
ncbi:MAG: TIGR02996 domain-containing protein [Kofleriaceae bacterium]